MLVPKKRTMKKVILIIVAILLIAVSLLVLLRPKVRNNATALIYKENASYLIVLTGTRYLMVHDPISALLGKTYNETYKITVPRINGIVAGSEIPVEKGYYHYQGQIEFRGNKMIVNLYYDNYDDNRKDALSWNGVYSIIINR